MIRKIECALCLETYPIGETHTCRLSYPSPADSPAIHSIDRSLAPWWNGAAARTADAPAAALAPAAQNAAPPTSPRRRRSPASPAVGPSPPSTISRSDADAASGTPSFDRKAWQAKYMKTYMRAYRKAKKTKSPKPLPG